MRGGKVLVERYLLVHCRMASSCSAHEFFLISASVADARIATVGSVQLLNQFHRLQMLMPMTVAFALAYLVTSTAASASAKLYPVRTTLIVLVANGWLQRLAGWQQHWLHCKLDSMLAANEKLSNYTKRTSTMDGRIWLNKSMNSAATVGTISSQSQKLSADCCAQCAKMRSNLVNQAQLQEGNPYAVLHL